FTQRSRRCKEFWKRNSFVITERAIVAEEERSGQMPENTILSVRNIVKTYPGVIAINHFSMDVREGEVHALIGENGAGDRVIIRPS
ncbi:MAG: hypothetical protein ACLTAC_11480, partial [Hungatella sp.]